MFQIVRSKDINSRSRVSLKFTAISNNNICNLWSTMTAVIFGIPETYYRVSIKEFAKVFILNSLVSYITVHWILQEHLELFYYYINGGQLMSLLKTNRRPELKLYSVWFSLCRFVCMPACLSIGLCVYLVLPVCLPVYRSVCLSVCLAVSLLSIDPL